MKRKWMKLIIALALCMTFACMAGTAAARDDNHDTGSHTAPDENGECTCGAKIVAQVDDAYFSDFDAAVAAWQKEPAVNMTLLDNVEYGQVIDLEHKCDDYSMFGCDHNTTKVLDLNDKTLTSTTNASYALRSNGQLTINDSGANGKGKFVASSDYTSTICIMSGKGRLNLNGGTFISQMDYVLELSASTAVIDSEKVKLSPAYFEEIYVQNPVSLTITGNGCDGWKTRNNSGRESSINIPDGFHLEDKAGKILDSNDMLPSGKYTTIKVDHHHVWGYTAEGDTITATCSNAASACPVPQATATIQLLAPAPEPLVYDGSPKTVTVEQTPADTFSDLPDVSYCHADGCVDAGEHTATLTCGDATAELKFTIKPIDITGASVTVNGDFTYNGTEHRPDNLTVTTGYGSSLSAGNYEIVGYSNNINAGSNATITISGKGNYTGEATGKFTIEKANPTAADFAMTPPENLYYTGEAKAATVAAANGVTGMGAITVRYSPENPVNEDSYDVLIDVAEGDNYLVATGLNVGSFTIGQSGSAFSGVKTYLGSNEEDEFTYGQLITVKGNVQATGKAPAKASRLLRAFTAPAAKQVALFDETGAKQLSAAAAVGDDGAFMLIYDTINKLVDPAESVTLMVKFVGDNNMANASTTVAIRLNACPVAPALSGAVTKPYDGTTAVPAGHGLSIQLDGLQSSDSVSASGSFAYEDAAAGTDKTVIASGIALDGEYAKFYTLSADTASSACGEITKAQAIPMSGTTHVINNHAQTYEIDLSQYLPALNDGKTFGSVSYALDRVELGSYYDGGAAISGSVLSLPISAVDSDEEKTAGAVTVTVSSQNYADSTLTLAVSTTNHQHQWNFTGSGDTITAACSNGDGACTVLQVSIRLVAPTDEELAYTGTAKTVTIEQTPAGMFGDLPAVRYCHADGCIGVGEHTATLTYRGATAEKKFTIGPVDAADAGGDAEIVDGTALIVTKDTRLPDSVAYYGETAKTALEEKFGAANTVVKIEVHMQEAGEAALAAMSNVDTGAAKVEVLEISLKYWDEPSGKWVKITEETLGLVPRHGVEVVIPYDLFGFTDVENFNQYRFVVQHMITLPMDDAYQIGDIEDLSGETVAAPEGLKIHVEHGFSPFVVGYAKVVDQAAISVLPQTGDNSQLGLWLAMLALCGAGVLTLRRKVQN